MWEGGRRVKWFTEGEVKLIEEGDVRHLELLKGKESAKIVHTRYGFGPPAHFKYADE